MNWTSPNTGVTLRDDEQAVAESYLKLMTPVFLFYKLFVLGGEDSWEAEVDFCLDKMSDWVDVRTLANQTDGEEDNDVAITMADYYTYHMGCWNLASGEMEWENWWNDKLDEQLIAEGNCPKFWRETAMMID